MPLQIECPNCQTTLEIPDNALGGKVQCPHCTGVLTIAAPPKPATAVRTEEKPLRRAGKRRRGDDRRRDDDRPRRRRQPIDSTRLYVILGIVGVVIFVIGGIVLIVRHSTTPRDNANVNGDNYEKIEAGMTMADIEKIFGPGREASVSEVNELIPLSSEADEPRVAFDEGAPKGFVYRWKNGKTNILILFDGPPKTAKATGKRFIPAPPEETPKRR
jgi:predicted Zn finger-like uncharacterized protein